MRGVCRWLGLILSVVFPLATVDAATTVNITVTVTMEGLSVTVSPTSWAIGTVQPDSSYKSPKFTATNDGGLTLAFTLQCGNSANWSSAVDTTSVEGANAFVMFGLFSTTTDSAATADSLAKEKNNDKIGTSAAAASSTRFGDAGLAGNASSVVADASRLLLLRFHSPSSSTSSASQSITVTLGGQ